MTKLSVRPFPGFNPTTKKEVMDAWKKNWPFHLCCGKKGVIHKSELIPPYKITFYYNELQEKFELKKEK